MLTFLLVLRVEYFNCTTSGSNSPSFIYLNQQHRESFGTTGLYELPNWIVEKLLAGSELGHIINELVQDSNTKEKQSTIGFLTNGEVDKLKNNTRAITFALVPFLQENLYFQ